MASEGGQSLLAGRGTEDRGTSLDGFGTDVPVSLLEGAFVRGEASRIYQAVSQAL